MIKKARPPATYEEAWAPEPPLGDTWTARPWVHPAVRREEGRVARKRVPRTSHAAFEQRPRRNPLAIIKKQEADRLQDLIPLRHARMAEFAFAYYRGTPAVMAFDLAKSPRTDIIVQASGDAHLANFGIFASPERRRLRHERLRRDVAGALGVGRQAPGGERRHRRPRQRLQRIAQPSRRPWPPSAHTASGWRATRRCASSTCGTRASPKRTSAAHSTPSSGGRSNAAVGANQTGHSLLPALAVATLSRPPPR